MREGACWKRRQVQHMLVELVRNLHNFLELHGITHWVDSGTLIGAVRHRGIVPYDQDADFGIDVAGYNYLRDTKVEVPAPYVLHVWNSSVNDPGNRDPPLPIRFINSESGLYVDVFVFIEEVKNGTIYMGPIESGCWGGCVECPTRNGGGHFQIPRDWILPVHPCKFNNFSVSCPHDTDKYLAHLFGDYMTPK
ncbi:TPA: hypothetical protein N0F65_000397 [Lagenidium giganteum]|uniref:LicD/FKTN/FKRP nucleotidyltransferase domain-containing protein n=1 Tax=Lagenidium giganteum TaxID=4803 RepID=A0AAV2Z1C0_9STRA|nr:TPA: hypothetical protein N0F65_000397 [Lagenidium giganteum]